MSSSNKNDKYLDLAFQIAQTVPRTASARVAALIVDKNNVISVGVNSMKTHPFVDKFKHDQWHLYLHAESDAILKAIRKISSKKLSKSTLYICRAKMINGEFEWGLSKPCESCKNVLKTFPVKECFFSTDATGSYERFIL